jgi:hypothetical protein
MFFIKAAPLFVAIILSRAGLGGKKIGLEFRLQAAHA